MIESGVIYLLQNKTFYAHVIMQCRYVVDCNMPYMMGVRIQDKVEIVYNPALLENLSGKEIACVLEHECRHLAHDHLPRSKNLDSKIYNIAADLAINQTLQKGIVERLSMVTLQHFPDLNLEKNKSAEYYYAALSNEAKQNPQFGGSLEGLHDGSHEEWGDSDTTNGSDMVARIFSEARKIVGDSHVDKDVLEWLESLNASVVNWRREIRYFTQQSMQHDQNPSRTKRNRRLGLLSPGYRADSVCRLAVVVDESGSIDSEMYTSFMSEIKDLAKRVHVHAYHFDTITTGDYEMTPTSKFTPKRHSNGGTDITHTFDLIDGEDFDGVVVFTDGDLFQNPMRLKKRVMWILPPGGNESLLYGKVITMDKV